MKKLLLPFLIFAAFLQTPATAQDCKYYKEGRDNVTGVPFKESRNVLVKNYAFQLRKDGDSTLSCYLDMVIIGSLSYTITPKDTLYLKLENYELVKLAPDKKYAPTKTANMNGIVSRYTPYYVVTREIFEKLAASRIVKARLLFDKVVEGEPKKPEAEAIMKAAACLLAK